MMRYRWSYVGAALISLLLVIGGVWANYIEYNAAYAQGYTNGRAAGYKDGTKDGYQSGHTDGYQIGYTDGDNAGYSIGVSDGIQQYIQQYCMSYPFLLLPSDEYWACRKLGANGL